MAKKFGGFTTQQQHSLLKEMGFEGPAQKDEMDAFLASNPAAAAKIGRYSEIAKQRIEGGPLSKLGMAEGGNVGINPPEDTNVPTGTELLKKGTETPEITDASSALDTSQQSYSDAMGQLTEAQKALSGAETPEGNSAINPETGRLNFPTYDALKEELGEDFGSGITAVDGTNFLAGTDFKNIIADPDNIPTANGYEITGSANNWTVTFNNGQTIKVNKTNASAAETVGAAAQKAFRKIRDSNLVTNTNAYNELLKNVEDADLLVTQTQADVSTAQKQFETTDIPSTSEALGKAITSPSSILQQPDVYGLKIENNQLIDANTGEVADLSPLRASIAEAAPAIQVPGRPLSIQENADLALRITVGLDEYDSRFDANGDGEVSVDDTLAILKGEYTVNPPNTYPPETYNAVMSQPEVKAALADFSAATGTPSNEALMKAETMLPEELAQLGLDPAQESIIREIPEIKRSLGAGETPTAALFDQYTKSDAAGFEGEVPEAEAAKFNGTTPEVGAETDYALGDLDAIERRVSDDELAQAMGDDLNPEQAAAAKIAYDARLAYAEGKISKEQLGKAITDYETVKTQQASRNVTNEEIAKAQGLGLTAEQASNVTSNYQPDIDAATDEVAKNELADAQTDYELDPAKAATLDPTDVEDAAKADEVPQAGDVESNYNSAIDAAKGDVDVQNEIINADKVVVGEAISVVGATMDKLNAEAKTKVAEGSFSQALEATAAQGVVSELSTVQGQMTQLMAQFDDGTPAWAAGAMRAAHATMAARGLGGSSMAGAAIIQAAMESAIPIAQADAQVFANMDAQNLSNRQQVAIANAAAKNNMALANLSNKQQAALQDSANAFALQSQSLSNTQAAVLAEAQYKYGLQEKTIDVNMQSALANAARYAEVNNINLSNSQQSLLQMSSENLQIEMANLSGKQQTALSNLQVRAAIAGQELTNEQQVAMLSSTQMFEAAQFSATAKQEAFMQDFQARSALEGQVLGNRQQTQLFNAARYAELNDINLSNEQQVALQKSVQSLEVEMANLSNRQQTELTNAQMRAALQGKVLDNQQQAEVLRAARYAEVNDINLSNRQQAFVQDAMIRATAENKVLDNKQQTMLFNAARYADVHDLTLSNEQQSLILQSTQMADIAIEDASNFQQTELANAQLRAALQGKVLDNKQQAEFMRATAYAEAANLTVSNKQMAVVQEYVSNASMQGQVLDNKQQAAIFNVTAQLEERQIELSNEQQTMLFNTTNKLTVGVEEMSNRQQTALANAQIEAAMRGQELSNQQQVNVITAERIAEVANMNFTAEQTRAIQNAQLAQTIDLANLNNRQAKMLADAAAMSQVDMANLNNRQQAAAQQAQAFLQMDMANLDNEQQAVMFEAQSLVQSILSDQAAENAGLQFNAESINQVNQFYESMSTQIEQFNVAQANAMEQFNAGEANSMEKFEAELANQRDIFNAQNELVIAQANTAWRQAVATANTAALNEANMQEVMAANNLTMQGLAELWQQERDLMNYAWSSAENQLGRDHELAKARISADGQESSAFSQAAGGFLSSLVTSFFKFGK